jgi:hypothetical protein
MNFLGYHVSSAITYKVHVSRVRSLLACATRESRPMGPNPDRFSLIIVVQLVLQLFRVLRIMSTQSTRGESYTRHEPGLTLEKNPFFLLEEETALSVLWCWLALVLTGLLELDPTWTGL